MKNLLFSLLLGFLTATSFASDNLHAWQKKLDNVGVRFNKDKTTMLVFTPNRISKWNVNTGELIASYDTYMSDLDRIPHRNATFIDADDLLTELVFQDADGSYHRFSFLSGTYINFPKFGNPLRIFHGYVHGNKMVYTTQGDYNVAVYDQDTGKDEIVHTKYYGYVQVPKEHKGVVVRDKDVFYFVDGETLKKKKLGIKNRYSDHKYLPDNWFRAYSTKQGKKSLVQFVNLETGKKEVHKGEDALQLFYPTSVPQPQTNFKRAIVSANEEQFFQIYSAGKHQDGNTTYYKYVIKQFDIATNTEVRQFNISSSEQDFLSYHSATKAREQVEFNEFKINFNQLPNNFVFDYNTAQGREIQNIPFVRNKMHPSVGSKELAIGKIAGCLDGGIIVLSMSFTASSDAQHSHFFIRQYDKDGILIDSKDMGETLRRGNALEKVTKFSIQPSVNSYSATAHWEFANKANLVKNYAGACAN